jgi:ubiquinone/menaquinone biosynthesis C-methylase UbiE
MKLNWAERWVVNNPLRVIQQTLEIRWMQGAGALGPGAIVLEVGCGRGAGAGLILREFQPSVLHAFDLDREMIRRAAAYLPAWQRKRIDLYVGDVAQLPYRDGVLDAVFSFGVLHHALDWQAAIGEIARVLKPGGVLFLEELYPTLYQNFLTKHILLHPRHNRFESHDLKGLLEKASLPLAKAFELKRLGILGVAVKKGMN